MLNKVHIHNSYLRKIKPAFEKKGCRHMPHTEPQVQVSDTTKADSSNAVYYIKKRHAKYAQRLK